MNTLKNGIKNDQRSPYLICFFSFHPATLVTENNDMRIEEKRGKNRFTRECILAEWLYSFHEYS